MKVEVVARGGRQVRVYRLWSKGLRVLNHRSAGAPVNWSIPTPLFVEQPARNHAVIGFDLATQVRTIERRAA